MKNTIQHLLCILFVAGSLTVSGQATDIQLCNLTFTRTVTDASAPQAHDGSISTTLTGGTAPIEYLWNTGATTSGISNLGTGYYSVTVSDYLLCSATAYGRVSAPGCQAMGVTINFFGAIDPNENYAFISNPTGTSPFTYIWSTGATTDSITHLPDGNYCVTATDAIGCSMKACAGNVFSTGIEEEIPAGEVKLYPNPVNNVLTVEIAGQQNAALTISSLEGRLLSMHSLNKGRNTIITETLPDGMYVYTISVSGTQRRLRGKVLILH